MDLHADSLLWSRDLLVRGSRGQVDIPRLIEGHVALQAFTVVTKTPRGINFQRHTGDSDNILRLALGEPHRALPLPGLAAARFRIPLARRRRAGPAITAGFLGIEGAHARDGNLANIDRLYAAGFRMLAPATGWSTWRTPLPGQ